MLKLPIKIYFSLLKEYFLRGINGLGFQSGCLGGLGWFFVVWEFALPKILVL